MGLDLGKIKDVMRGALTEELGKMGVNADEKELALLLLDAAEVTSRIARTIADASVVFAETMDALVELFRNECWADGGGARTPPVKKTGDE